MQAQQKLEIGGRIKELRERSPYKQKNVAAKLGLEVRSYQKLEAKGTEDYERCEAIYKIHREWLDADPEWAHVSPGWIWDGRDRRGNLMESLSAARTPATAEELQGLKTELLAAVATAQREIEDLLRQKEPSRKKRKDTGS